MEALEIKLRHLIKKAMQNKKENPNMETNTICITRKNILETAQKIAKEKRIETLSDSMIIDAAKKEIKQANDLLVYITDKNSDKYTEIQLIIKTAQEFLPQMLTEEEIRSYIQSHRTELHTIGETMKALKMEYGDRLDGKLASQIVKESFL